MAGTVSSQCVHSLLFANITKRINMSILHTILTDLKINLTEEFDRNFERKAFFSQRWQPTKKHIRRGSILVRTSRMRNSIRSTIQGESIVFSSALPYTAIHNEGGKAGRGHKATIPKRQFIGDAPEVEHIIKQNVDEELPRAIEAMINQQFNNNH